MSHKPERGFHLLLPNKHMASENAPRRLVIHLNSNVNLGYRFDKDLSNRYLFQLLLRPSFLIVIGKQS